LGSLLLKEVEYVKKELIRLEPLLVRLRLLCDYGASWYVGEGTVEICLVVGWWLMELGSRLLPKKGWVQGLEQKWVEMVNSGKPIGKVFPDGAYA
ncbi:hypothetical protein A2U01_0017146, partial [Trifolium medium]|nr:hypothetical protein [Trifolium medium]